MTLRLNGSTSGYAEIDAPAVAGNNKVTLPDGTGQLQLMRQTDAIALLSGTHHDFLDIPSWAKRITVNFTSVSTNGANSPLIVVGDSTGYNAIYTGSLAYIGPGSVVATTEGGQAIVLQGQFASTPASAISGRVTIEYCALWNGDHFWAYNGVISRIDSGTSHSMNYAAGNLRLSGDIDRLRVGSVTGVSSFTGGLVNTTYEG